MKITNKENIKINTLKNLKYGDLFILYADRECEYILKGINVYMVVKNSLTNCSNSSDRILVVNVETGNLIDFDQDRWVERVNGSLVLER